jgi:hypothetical protein
MKGDCEDGRRDAGAGGTTYRDHGRVARGFRKSHLITVMCRLMYRI